MPKVSIIIPTYKRSEMLPRAINSVLNQTYKNIEIIVIDDNNPESHYRQETAEVMDEYKKNQKVKYIQHTKNKNGAVARNTGIANSHGEIITFLDDDDWYTEDKVQKQVEYLLRNKKYKAVYCGAYRESTVHSSNLTGDLSFEILSGEITIRTNTIMIWKDIIVDIGGWNEHFIRNQEAALLLRFFAKGYKLGVIKAPLVHYDLTDRSNSLDPIANLKQFEFHLNYHKNLIERLDKENKNAKAIIYTRRYRSILFSFLKNKDFLGAMGHYFRILPKYPIRFNLEIINYLYSKLFLK